MHGMWLKDEWRYVGDQHYSHWSDEYRAYCTAKREDEKEWDAEEREQDEHDARHNWSYRTYRCRSTIGNHFDDLLDDGTQQWVWKHPIEGVTNLFDFYSKKMVIEKPSKVILHVR